MSPGSNWAPPAYEDGGGMGSPRWADMGFQAGYQGGYQEGYHQSTLNQQSHPEWPGQGFQAHPPEFSGFDSAVAPSSPRHAHQVEILVLRIEV